MKRNSFIHYFLSLLGISATAPLLLNSCEKEEVIPEVEVEEELSEEEKAYLELKKKTAEKGFFLDGKLLYVDISHSNYSNLKTVGKFINDTDHYVLLLRITESSIKAFNNCCPHLGTSNRWSYSNGNFRCANHGNSYGTGTGFVANCSSNSTSGNLKQYSTTLVKDILTVDFS